MKQIFLESHHLKNKNFGFGQFNYHLIKEMIKQVPANFRLVVHTKDVASAKKDFGGSPKYKPYYSLRRYPLFQIRKNYDLWHSLNQNTKIEPRHNLPYLLTIHDTSMIEDPSSYEHSDSFQRLQAKINRSNAITYISEFAQKSTHQFFKVPDIPEYIIHNGNPFQELDLPKNFKTDFTPKKPFLFTIGEIKKRKNFKSLIKMLSHLSDYHLVLAGKNTTGEAEEIRALIQKLNLTDRVTLTGRISEAQKQYFYKHCRAFVFPSLHEGFGLPVVEAMHFGKPVFTSFNTSLPEIGGDCAFYWHNFDPEEMAQKVEQGVTEFSADPELYQKKYKERSELFSWSKAAEHYIEVYQKLLN